MLGGRGPIAGIPRLAARMAATAIVGATASWPGPAAAIVVQRQLQFTCSSQYGGGTLSLQAEADVPDSVSVGQPVPGVVVHVTGQTSSLVSFGLGLIGATSIEGWTDVAGTLTAPGVDENMTTRFVMPNTPVPASGPVTAQATGTTPGFTFPNPGVATVTWNGSFTGYVTPVTSSGTTPLGAIALSCTLDPGYSKVLYSLSVRPADPAQPTPAQQTSVSSTVSGPSNSATSAARSTSTATSMPSGPSTLFDTSSADKVSPSALIDPSKAAGSTQASSRGGSGLGVVAALGAVGVCISALAGTLWIRQRRRSAGTGTSSK